MRPYKKIAGGYTVALLGMIPFAANAAKSDKLNVILILTDDQGYGDMSCHGNPNIKTPAIDKLHAESICFENYHSGTTSAPTRAGLMTGHYCNATGVWHTIMGRSIMNLQEVTLAEVFRNSGYHTAMFGKWHLGDNFPYRPQDRGFDMALCIGGGGIGQTPDYWENTYFDDTYYRNGITEKIEGYGTDVLFNEAIKDIDAHKNDRKPFFCFISTPAPHSPYNVADKYYNLYKNNPEVVNAGFYGMISNLDENLARLDDYLKKNKLDKNTIVIYMSDNGTASGVALDKEKYRVRGYNAGMRGLKGSVYEGGHRVVFMMRIPGKKPAIIHSLSSYVDFMPTIVDICTLKMPKSVDFHGISLIPVINGKSAPERYIFTDTQRSEKLSKNKSYCVMSQQWRLINGNELYDIEKDPEQRTNLSSQNPSVVQKMQKAYDTWWNMTSHRADRFEYIRVGDRTANPVVLNGHDTHDDLDRGAPWNQESVRNALRTYGFWAVEVAEDGDYLFELYRYDPDANLPLLSKAPQGKNVPNGKPYPEGKALAVQGAVIRLDGKEIGRAMIDASFNKNAVSIPVTLRRGEYRMEGNFIDKDGEFCAYYVKVTSHFIHSQ